MEAEVRDKLLECSEKGTIPLSDILLVLVKNIVDDPESVRVTATKTRTTEVIELDVNPEDMGKVIGKRGRVARSIRTVLGAVAMRRRVRVTLGIVDPLNPKNGANGYEEPDDYE